MSSPRATEASRSIQLICTLGPASFPAPVLKQLDKLGVDLYRLNMSHTTLEELPGLIRSIRHRTSTPLCIDTEGPQVRTGPMRDGQIMLHIQAQVTLVQDEVMGDRSCFTLKPPEVFNYLKPGMLLSVDFHGVLLLLVECTKTEARARVLCAGPVGANHGISIDQPLNLPPFTIKDRQAMQIAQEEGIRHFALSFVHQPEAVWLARQLLGPEATLIAKVESRPALSHIEEILLASDAILLDRGDLSRDVPVEQLPFWQRHILQAAARFEKPAYVATNLLESMTTSPHPSRAEVNDIISTLWEGAQGLVLAAETAIGRYPVQSVRMVRRLIHEYLHETWRTAPQQLQWLGNGMLENRTQPHGGSLVHRFHSEPEGAQTLKELPRLRIDSTRLRDLEQIALGVYSPLTGFMGREELNSVLESCSLADGTVWPLPIVLPVIQTDLRLRVGDRVALVCSCCDEVAGILDLNELYRFDSSIPMEVRNSPGGFLAAGPITLLKRHRFYPQEFSLSPVQTRAIFSHRGWDKVVGLFADQISGALESSFLETVMGQVDADGLFLLNAGSNPEQFAHIRASVCSRLDPEKVLLGGSWTRPGKPEPRGNLLAAICVKNFGCSHILMESDSQHNGKSLLEKVGLIGIEPILIDLPSALDRGRVAGRFAEV